jgi:hypothetical protein
MIGFLIDRFLLMKDTQKFSLALLFIIIGNDIFQS